MSAILNAHVPVIVYVSPAGGWAGSAGTFITISSHVAAMAPGSRIGAAHPVSIGQENQQEDVSSQKIAEDAAAWVRSLAQMRGRNAEAAELAVLESKSYSDTEALKLDLVDLSAKDLEDNLDAARPQTGLGEAGVVYEMEAEARITRFMALFAGDQPSVVGPVRSARSYYLQICKEWDAIYAHVGGSKDAVSNIKSWGIKDLDQFQNGGEYWRDNSRNAPHNVYLNVEEAASGKEAGLQPHWQFEDPSQDDADINKFSFSYRSGYQVTYEFSEGEKNYLRYINGSPHSDRESGEQIAVTNVVLQYASHQDRNDGTGCIDIQVIGSGSAEYFLAGQYQQGSWQKDSMDSPTRFFDADGQEVIFARGNTWIQLLRPGTQIEKV